MTRNKLIVIFSLLLAYSMFWNVLAIFVAYDLDCQIEKIHGKKTRFISEE